MTNDQFELAYEASIDGLFDATFGVDTQRYEPTIYLDDYCSACDNQDSPWPCSVHSFD